MKVLDCDADSRKKKLIGNVMSSGMEIKAEQNFMALQFQSCINGQKYSFFHAINIIWSRNSINEN